MREFFALKVVVAKGKGGISLVRFIGGSWILLG